LKGVSELLSTAEVASFDNGLYTPDSYSEFTVCLYSESSNTAVQLPLSACRILISLFSFSDLMLLSSLPVILEVGDCNLSNEDLIFRLDGESFETTESTALVMFGFEPGYDTAKFKHFFSYASSVSERI
jgi:hypothetical protein